VVLERREVVAAARSRRIPSRIQGFDAGAHAGAAASDIAREMRLERFKFGIFHPDPRMIALGPDGKAIVFYNDAAKTAGGITRISAKDGSRYTEFAAALGKLPACSSS